MDAPAHVLWSCSCALLVVCQMCATTIGVIGTRLAAVPVVVIRISMADSSQLQLAQQQTVFSA